MRMHLAGACIPDGTGGKRNDHNNIDDCADNCVIEMVPVLLGNIGDTSVLCRMRSGITRSGHNTEVSSQSVTQTAWD